MDTVTWYIQSIRSFMDDYPSLRQKYRNAYCDRFTCVKVIMFGAMILLWRYIKLILMLDFGVINTSYIIIY